MATSIRPKDLPAVTSADPADRIIIDGATTRSIAVSDLLNVVNVSQFMLISETTIEAAAMRALAAMSRPGKLVFPAGIFHLASSIVIPSGLSVHIEGAGMLATYLVTDGAFSAFSHTGSCDYCSLSDISIDGNATGFAAFSGEAVTHSTFRRVYITGTTIAGIRANNGYNIDVLECEILSNSGGGISVSGENINNLNVVRNKIFANAKIGIEAGNGLNVNILGNTIEGNDEAGIMAYAIQGLNIRNNYFERNGKNGHAYTIASGSPEDVTIKADIHLNAAGRFISSDVPIDAAIIDGNSFAPYGSNDVPTSGLSQDVYVFAGGVANLCIENNGQFADAGSGHVTAMLGLYNNNAHTRIGSVKVDQNTINNIVFLGTASDSFAFNSLHNLDTASKPGAHNYASEEITDYGVLSGTTGSLNRAANDFMDAPVLSLAPGDQQYGYDVDLTKHPELKGQIVYVAVPYNTIDTGSALQLSLGGKTDSDGSVTDTAFAVGEYRYKSVCKLVSPSDSTLVFGIKRVGTGTDPILVGRPIISVAGFGANRFNVSSLQSSNVSPLASGTAAVGTSTRYARADHVHPSVAWTGYTPTLSSTGGIGFTSATAHGLYRQDGKTVHYSVDFTITTVGSATGFITFTLPVAASSATGKYISAGIFAGTSINATVNTSGTTGFIATYNAGATATSTGSGTVTGVYQSS